MTTTTMTENQTQTLQATAMLCCRLIERPDHTPLSAEEYHWLRLALATIDLNPGHLIERWSEIERILQAVGYHEDDAARMQHLMRRGTLLAIQKMGWDGRLIQAAEWHDRERYPESLMQLDDRAPAICWWAGESDRMRQPDNCVAVLTGRECSPRANGLVDQVAEKIAAADRTLAVRLDHNSGRALAFRTLEHGGAVIGQVGNQATLKKETLVRPMRDAMLAGKLTLWSGHEPDVRAVAEDEGEDRLLLALADRRMRLCCGVNPSVSAA